MTKYIMQTDRQTDKSQAWSVTAFNDEILLLEDNARYPNFVKEVHGGREMCPTTNKVHFQGALILKSQQRLSALKKWLPTAHFEACRQIDALKKYSMKEDTAVGDKVVRENETPHYRMEELLMMIAHNRPDEYVYYDENQKYKEEYWAIVNKIVYISPRLISAFTIPAMEKAWVQTRSVWIRKEGELRHSITGADTESVGDSPLNEFTPAENNLSL